MNIKKTPLIILIATLALLFTGCESNDKRYAHDKGTNFLGIMKSDPASFKNPDDKTSLILKTSDLTNTQNISGDETSFLWGLIRVQDY